jgi:hypothetical protein
MRFSAAVSLTILLVVPSAFAQDLSVAPEKQREKEAAAVLKKQLAEVQARVPIENPVKGAPYSADIVIETSQTLADGNHISKKTAGRVYRDAEGRTRREQEGTMSVTRENPIVSTKKLMISIVDPVAGVSYALDTEHKIAWRTTSAASGALQGELTLVKRRLAEERAAALKADAERHAHGGGAAPAEPDRAEMAARARGEMGGGAQLGPLEHKMVEGLAVEGRRNTEVIPAGAVGNDMPITITSEEWTSPDLHVLVLTRHSDPRSGDTTYRLTNVVRGEPDPSLFTVPPDYTVKDTEIRRHN